MASAGFAGEARVVPAGGGQGMTAYNIVRLRVKQRRQAGFEAVSRGFVPPKTGAILDRPRPFLEDLGGGLGQTHAVSGQVIVDHRGAVP